MITIIKDIDLINEVEKYDVILVGTNTYHVMGNGFQRKVRTKYPTVYDLNITTKYGDTKKMGTVVSTTSTPIFSLCFITNGYNFRPDINPDYLNYESLEKCLKYVNQEYSGLNIATTMIGCSKFDGNGDKERVMEIINNNSDKINLFVYDYVQLTRDVESVIRYTNVVKNESYDRDKKTEIIKQFIEDDKKLHSISDNPSKRLSKIKEEVKKLIKK